MYLLYREHADAFFSRSAIAEKKDREAIDILREKLPVFGIRHIIGTLCIHKMEDTLKSEMDTASASEGSLSLAEGGDLKTSPTALPRSASVFVRYISKSIEEERYAIRGRKKYGDDVQMRSMR